MVDDRDIRCVCKYPRLLAGMTWLVVWRRDCRYPNLVLPLLLRLEGHREWRNADEVWYVTVCYCTPSRQRLYCTTWIACTEYCVLRFCKCASLPRGLQYQLFKAVVRINRYLLSNSVCFHSRRTAQELTRGGRNNETFSMIF